MSDPTTHEPVSDPDGEPSTDPSNTPPENPSGDTASGGEPEEPGLIEAPVIEMPGA